MGLVAGGGVFSAELKSEQLPAIAAKSKAYSKGEYFFMIGVGFIEMNS